MRVVQVEWQDDEDVVASAMDLLRRVYGDSIPDPTVIHVSRWGKDPFSRGEGLGFRVGVW